MTSKRIAVFCGSSSGVRPSYGAAAEAFGAELVRRGYGLVYGGAKVGLMGTVAAAVLAAGGDAVGVLPRFLAAKEIAHEGLTNLHLVETMHERKAKMAELSCAFVALPGGFGTLEELFEVLTWSQLGLHAKPCALLDVDGFYAPLAAFADHASSEGFLRREHRQLLLVERDGPSLLDAIERFEPPRLEKWVTPERT